MFSTQVTVLSLACCHLLHREDEMGPSDGRHHAPELTCNQRHPALVPAHAGGLGAAQCSHLGPTQPRALNPPSPCHWCPHTRRAQGTSVEDLPTQPHTAAPPVPSECTYGTLPPAAGQAHGQGLGVELHPAGGTIKGCGVLEGCCSRRGSREGVRRIVGHVKKVT